MFNTKKAPEELEQRAAEKAQRQAERETAAFAKTPAGQAREAYERGSRLFQVTFNLEDVSGIILYMMRPGTQREAHDTSEVLDSIAAEGWEFKTLSTTFVSEGSESRDRFLASGQQTAVRGGRVMGTYVFIRAE